MSQLQNMSVAILATDGFEQSELCVPKEQLSKAGAKVQVVSPKSGSIRSWSDGDWGESSTVDCLLDEAKAGDFDALVLPGGQINPDLLRVNAKAVEFIASFASTGKPVAAICHAPWLLVEADLVKGRKMTSYASIRTDVENAGGKWEDSEVVVDGNLITSRKPDDLDAFCRSIISTMQD